MKKYILLLSTILFLPLTVSAQTWYWKGTPVTPSGNDNWSDASNWLQGTVAATSAPSTTSDVVINTCTVCPKLTDHVAIKSITINTNGKLNLQNFTLTVSGNTYLYFATITSNEGKISSAQITEVNGSVFNGVQPLSPYELTIEINAGVGGAQWSGGNVYNCPVIFNSRSTGVFYMQRWAGDTFNETVVFNNYASLSVGVTAGAKYWKKVTFNNIDNAGNGSIQRATFYGEFEANNISLSTINIAGTFKGPGPVKLNNKNPGPNVTYMTYGNSIWIGDSWTPVTTFEGAVIVTNTSLRSAAYTGVDIVFNNPTYNTNNSCIFTSTASLSIGTDASGVSLFRRGNLFLRNCTFQTPQTTNLFLSSGNTPESFSSQLNIASGTTFTGPLQVTTPHILLNGATFNQEASFTKTAAGVNNSLGGNRFKKKVTLINQAPGNSPMNLATVTDDIIQQ